MRFRWDWLSSAISVPYVPTLGPVRPQALSAELFDAVASVAHTGHFLPYNKDRRWSSTKDERVITQEIIHRPELTVIPTLSTRGRGVLKIHYYGHGEPDVGHASEWSRTWMITYGAATGRLIWFDDMGEGARTRLMLKTFEDQEPGDSGAVMSLKDCPYASTFPAFTEEIGPEGFAFLYQRMQAGIDDGPVLVAVQDDRIVGAIGPLATMTDSTGAIIQPPQYFAVHPGYRSRGHGRNLWRASMAWGRANGAGHKVLQASVGTPAEQLYLSERLVTLGFMHAVGVGS
ncbi:GNAT family N-acetyltransferase [Actinoallomurus sp. CA-150999]|uniref:GNAT family N-acetyltransferase n=1 Tax=Actinoallomurus sp. CA-150999 TaxID=3239887 RepID=UPI003D8B0D6F